jgi:acetyltransferase-like isoleucine patch superfamily enzyme
MPSAALLCGHIHIGKETFVGDDVLITGGDVHIGDRCDIAPRAILHAGSHEIGDRHRRAGRTYSGKIVVGDGSWIGTGAIILDGARIGRGVIVAAGSVVRKGVYPDNSLLAGVPALIKKSYAQDG